MDIFLNISDIMSGDILGFKMYISYRFLPLSVEFGSIKTTHPKFQDHCISTRQRGSVFDPSAKFDFRFGHGHGGFPVVTALTAGQAGEGKGWQLWKQWEKTNSVKPYRLRWYFESGKLC